MFALDLKSFLKEHAIVMKAKEIVRFIARTNLSHKFSGAFGLLKLSLHRYHKQTVLTEIKQRFSFTAFWPQITLQILGLFMAFYKITKYSNF